MCEGEPIGPEVFTPPAWTSNHTASIYNTSAPMFGAATPLFQHRTRVAMVVNIASA